jgi:hypothetical protein
VAKGFKTGGPPKKHSNKASTEAREACSRVIDDAGYRDQLLARARSGKLAPAVEVMLWHYAKVSRRRWSISPSSIAIWRHYQTRSLQSDFDYGMRVFSDSSRSCQRVNAALRSNLG